MVIQLLILLLLLPYIAFADCTATRLHGSDGTQTSFGTITDVTMGKAVQWDAIATGNLGCFKLEIYDVTDDASTGEASIAWALYDNNPASPDDPGVLLASQCYTGVDLTSGGLGVQTRVFEYTGETVELTSSSTYWIFFSVSTLSVQFRRRSTDENLRRYHTGVNDCTFPGNDVGTWLELNQGVYGWSIFEAGAAVETSCRAGGEYSIQ